MITRHSSVVPVQLAEALNQAWLAIRKETVARKLPAVPDAAVTVGPGPLHVTDWDTPVVLVPPSTVAQGGRAILEFLLHQAAHSLARDFRRRPNATNAVYHSAVYKQAAERVGLAVTHTSSSLGWSDTSLTPELERIYADQLTALDAAVAGQRPAQFSRNGITAYCPAHPDFKIRIRGADAAERLQAHPLRCALDDVELIMMPGK